MKKNESNCQRKKIKSVPKRASDNTVEDEAVLEDGEC
jgi:hypothetical protein